LTNTHTTAAGQATAKHSLQLFATTPFLDFHNHPTKPFINPNPPVLFGIGIESASKPITDLSLALAAACQSAVESILGAVTLRCGYGVFGEGVIVNGRFERFEEERRIGLGEEIPRPEFLGIGRKYDVGSLWNPFPFPLPFTIGAVTDRWVGVDSTECPFM
jgi:hypothetical protein